MPLEPPPEGSGVNLPPVRTRVACFVDGFNLYHAIDELGANHLKWVNLWSLTEHFLDLRTQKLVAVYYCSAYATWKPESYARHRQFVMAQQCQGVEPIMGSFKERWQACHRCPNKWAAHEEKESDVNIAVQLVHHAYRDTYDNAILVTADSDIVPAVRLVRHEFPNKRVKILAPPKRRHSKELVDAAGGKGHCAAIKPIHLEWSLLPEQMRAEDGTLLATRPAAYRPPPRPPKREVPALSALQQPPPQDRARPK